MNRGAGCNAKVGCRAGLGQSDTDGGGRQSANKGDDGKTSHEEAEQDGKGQEREKP